MEFYNTAGSAIKGYNDALSADISAALKTLLESKHLYQKVSVDSQAVREAFLPKVESRIKEHGNTGHFSLDAALVPWICSTDQLRMVNFLTPGSNTTPSVVFAPPDVKLYCSRTCKRREAFNLVSASLAAEKARKRFEKPEELYILTYLCQSCKSVPDAFMVRRQGEKLQLVGRSPMEHVEVPDVIPKQIETYYSGAVIAFQSGQSLAANFMLRTACEQWARKWADPTDRADGALEKYMAALPGTFKAHFPSLNDIYTQLSADIHAATGSETLFTEMTEKLVEHFDARRLYKLPVGPETKA